VLTRQRGAGGRWCWQRSASGYSCGSCSHQQTRSSPLRPRNPEPAPTSSVRRNRFSSGSGSRWLPAPSPRSRCSAPPTRTSLEGRPPRLRPASRSGSLRRAKAAPTRSPMRWSPSTDRCRGGSTGSGTSPLRPGSALRCHRSVYPAWPWWRRQPRSPWLFSRVAGSPSPRRRPPLPTWCLHSEVDTTMRGCLLREAGRNAVPNQTMCLSRRDHGILDKADGLGPSRR
jgi:hypothetical protein